MAQPTHSAGPPPSTPDDGGGNGEDGGARHGAAVSGAPMGATPPLASFSIMQQRNLRVWPRQRRRVPKSPSSTPLPRTSSSSSGSPTSSALPGSASPPPPPFPPFPSTLPAFSQHQSQQPQQTQQLQQPKQAQHRRQRPYPLHDHSQGRAPSDSPPLLPSPPPSAPSVTETPKEIEQLAGDLSRQHLERTGYGDSRSTPGHGFANFSFGMAEFRLRSGGNAPVTDLEVDMEHDSRNDDGDCIMRPTSPDTSPQLALPLPSLSSYVASVEVDNGPSVPPSLQRIRQRQIALAAAATASTTVEAAEAAAAPIEAADMQPSPPPSTVAAVTTPYPERSFHLHTHSLSHSYPSQSQSQSHPHSRQHSTSTAAAPPASAWSSQFSPFLPLSPESLAMPHLAPLHNDVPSSGYDLQAWLDSSSTVESMPALTTGAIDSTGASISTAPASAPRTIQTLVENMISNGDQCTVRTPTERLPTTPSSPLLPSLSQTTLASTRRQQTGQSQQQLYTAYLPTQPMPLYIDASDPLDLTSGPNPPVPDLEVDMEGVIAIDHAATAVAASLAASATASAAASASATSYATHQGSITGNGNSRHMLLSQRLQRVHMEMAREAMRIRSDQSASGSAVDDPTNANANAPAAATAAAAAAAALLDPMDVEMADPAGALGLEPSLSPGLPAAMDEDWLDRLPSLRRAGQPNGIRKYMGPLRYRLSAEVALQCTNLVHSKPRMRRRKRGKEGSDDGGGSSSKDGGGRDKGKDDGERSRDRSGQDREDRDREPHRGGREKRSKSSRHREPVRPAQAQAQPQPQPQTQVQTQEQVEAHAQQEQEHTPQHQLQPPVPPSADPEPIDVIPIDMP